MTLFFIALLLTLAVFACNTHYAHKENVYGQVTPMAGSLRIIAGRNGVAEQVLVHEGQAVKAGQELIGISSAPRLQRGDVLSDSLRRAQASELLAQRRQAQAKLDQLQRQLDEVGERRRNVGDDVLRLEAAGRLQQSRIEIQEQSVAAAHALTEQGMLSQMAMRTRDDALLAARQTLAGLEREAAQQRSLLVQLGAQVARLNAEMRMVRSETDNIEAQSDEHRLVSEATYADHLSSPVDGVVTALQVHPGAPVTSNQTLAIVIPAGPARQQQGLEVELWAPSRAIGMLRPGARVHLMYDAFPYQTFGVSRGVVRDIASAPIMPNELPVPIESKEQLFRVRVALDRASLSAYGRDWPLVPGMRLSADLVLEDRSLLDWLLDPLRAARRHGA
ncbi:HlyD family efflux transporter periplasmic adaptor subunit [Duganella sp.]|uniref:HlyD family secretion protein n=1 Tax=Duganella sp. TaxID=1904440 RepID=UPI0031E3B88E